MKNKVGIIFMAMGLALLLGAGGLLLYNNMQEAHAAEQSSRVADVLLTYIEKNQSETMQGSDEIEQPVPSQAPDTVQTMSSLHLDGYDYVGILSIPAMDLTLPILRQWSYNNLRVAPCLYNMDVETNTIVIAAHNYRTHFGGINRLMVGNDVTYTAIDGTVYRYQVAQIVTTSATDVKGMLSSDWDLTLFTCNYGGEARIAVRCKMVR